MTWTFNQATGELTNPAGVVVATGYAGGNCGRNPEGKNNPDMQAVRCIGPLPVGVYYPGNPVEGSHLGPFAIPLIPQAGNQMFGRGDFYMHGDTIESPGCASEGCIVMPRNIRNEVSESGDTVTVVRGV